MATDITSMDSENHQSSSNAVVYAIVGLICLYLLSAIWGLPEHATELVVESLHHAEEGGHETHGDAGGDHGAHNSYAPPVWTIIPFVVLLLAIAVLPLIHKTEHWWENNLNRFKVSASLAVLTLGYYAFLHHSPVEAHWPAHSVVNPTDSALQTGFVGAILGNAVLSEFVPFIVLLFSLYTIAGGVRIEGDLQANPMTNASFMGVGGLLASFIGTTGAAMLLIRPLLDTNSERKHVRHTVIFFIFIVCNCGGCLLPIGDPPLFLGYLEGVDFFWTFSLWAPWLFVNGLLLLTYCILDQFFYYPKETAKDIRRDIQQTRKLKITGLGVNLPLLLGVVLCVALLDPKKAIPGTHWHPWMFMREILQLALVAVSLYFGSKKVRVQNQFNYHAIIEVAALFIGIFICMQPALQILGEHGRSIASWLNPSGFFWATGALSSFLDNAPTYLVFFKAAQEGPATGVTAGVPETVLIAVSLGAVFMGAMTYIGNGPNFMVKAIAEKSGVKMPSFFGYMGYSCAILLPILLLANWRHIGDAPDEVPASQLNPPAAVSTQTH